MIPAMFRWPERHRSVRHRAVLRLATAVAVLSLAGLTEARAQQNSNEDQTEFDGLNFAFASVLGSGYYSIQGRQALILRVPISHQLREAEEDSWGLRLIFPVTLGFFDLKPEDVIPDLDPDNLGSINAVAGVEFSRLLARNWVLFPFGMVGPAVEGETGEFAWILSVGVDSRAEFGWKTRKLVLWNGLLYARDFRNDRLSEDDFVRFETDFEIRQPVSARTAIGFVVENELFLDELVVNRPGEPLGISRRWTVGISYGPTEPDVKFWKMKVPRISVGYRFGQGIDGFKLGFRYRY
jgi:hypothetical protein